MQSSLFIVVVHYEFKEEKHCILICSILVSLSSLSLCLRVELLFSQVPELMFWAWHAMRHFTFFFYSIFICSLKKNINDR